MNILQIQGNSGYGGSEIHTFLLARGLIKSGFNVIVVIQPGGPVSDELKKYNIPFFELDILNKWNFSSTLKLRNIIKQNKINIVHSHLRNADFHSFLATRFLKNISLITTLHDFLFLNKDGNIELNFNAQLYKFIIKKHFCSIITISKSIYDNCASIIKDSSLSKLITIMNFTDTEMFSDFGIEDLNKWKVEIMWNPKYFYIGFVARMTKQKGHFVFLKALQKLLKHRPDVKAVLVGDGLLYPEINKYISNNPELKSNIVFLGYQRNFYPLYKLFDITVVPSLWEAFGRVILESFFFETPVLASNTGGIHEIIDDGRDGWLFETGSADDLYSKLNNIINIKSELRSIGKIAKQKVLEYYNLDRSIKEHINLYNRLKS